MFKHFCAHAQWPCNSPLAILPACGNSFPHKNARSPLAPFGISCLDIAARILSALSLRRNHLQRFTFTANEFVARCCGQFSVATLLFFVALRCVLRKVRSLFTVLLVLFVVVVRVGVSTFADKAFTWLTRATAAAAVCCCVVAAARLCIGFILCGN